MNFRLIKVKYTALFSGVAVLLMVVAIADQIVINSTKGRMMEFSHQFTSAISAILNADRDLYQARLAELQSIVYEGDPGKLNSLRGDYEENAQQAFDRMQKFKEYTAAYPDITEKLGQFDATFRNWRAQSEKVLTLVEAGDSDGAYNLANGASGQAFGDLRNIYDIAGEAADAKVDELEAITLAQISSNRVMVVSLTVLGIIAATLTAIFGPSTLARSIREVSIRIKEIADGDGDLTQRIQSTRKDEVGELANHFDDFVHRLNRLMAEIKDQSDYLQSRMDNLKSSSSQANSISESQASSSESVATAVNEMSAAIREVANNATNTADEINTVETLAMESKQVLSKSVDQIGHLSDNITQSVQVVERLSEDSDNIVSVLDVIRGIAEQTNLLALNAAIEAARAGEQGRGFAVVADEVRTLASKTQESTESIQDMIQRLQSGVSDAVTSIRTGAEVVESTVELAQKASESIGKITASTSTVANMSTQTATATEEQSHVAEDINVNLTTLADSTHESQNLSHALRQLAEDVNEKVLQLHGQVNKFRTH